MLYIYGVRMNKMRKVRFALTDVFGIGLSSAQLICDTLSIPKNLKTEELTETQIIQISQKIKQEFRLENNLREEIKGNIQRYITNGSIRGFRHRHHLPVRGQRTHSNAKTPRRIIMGLAIKTNKR